MGPVSIIPGTLRDVTWITGHLAEQDRREAFCQLDTTPVELGAFLAQGGCYVACYRGRPVMAFGASPVTCVGVSIWAVGTKDSWRAVREVTRFFRTTLVPDLYRAGYRWGEARSLATHKGAHRWMESTGARAVLYLAGYGKDGEDFILFRWTRDFFEGEGQWNATRKS